jgi:hypothetical protein
MLPINKDMKRYLKFTGLLLALCVAIFAGWVDFNNDEPQAAALIILVMTILLGWLQPAKAWLWAIIVASGLPGMYLMLRALGYQPASPPSPRWFASLLALIPAFIGAYAGVFARAIVSNAAHKSS